MKKQKRFSDAWYGNLALVLILAAMVILIITSVVMFAVNSIVTDKLTDLTSVNILQSQIKASVQMTDKIITVPSALASVVDKSSLGEKGSVNKIFPGFSEAVPEIKSMQVYDVDSFGNVSLIESSLGLVQPTIIILKNARQMVFGNNTILSVGQPYKDNMGIHTMIPVFITFYTSGKPDKIIVLEMDLSLILYNTIGDNVKGNFVYKCSLYSENLQLLDVIENNMKIRVYSDFDNSNGITITHSERETLFNSSKYTRLNGDSIELFNVSELGFILMGEVRTDDIGNTVSQIKTIITLSMIGSVVLFIIMGFILSHMRKKKVADVRMAVETVQAKLDPHFLFNTLNCMVGLASSDDKELIDGFRNLSGFLRSSINTDIYATLTDEITMLENYFAIQKLRYGTMFSYNIEIKDSSLYNVEIPRFTIQPIVENCFVHSVAITDYDKTTTIELSAAKETDNIICIKISNNGPFTDEDIEKANKLLSSKYNYENGDKSLGISLINHELKLIYGKKYGISVYKNSNNCFEVAVRIPFNIKKD